MQSRTKEQSLRSGQLHKKKRKKELCCNSPWRVSSHKLEKDIFFHLPLLVSGHADSFSFICWDLRILPRHKYGWMTGASCVTWLNCPFDQWGVRSRGNRNLPRRLWVHSCPFGCLMVYLQDYTKATKQISTKLRWVSISNLLLVWIQIKGLTFLNVAICFLTFFINFSVNNAVTLVKKNQLYLGDWNLWVSTIWCRS